MISLSWARAGRCLFTVAFSLALAGAELQAQNILRIGNVGPELQSASSDDVQLEPVGSQPELAPVGSPTVAESDGAAKSRSRRWRKTPPGTQAGESAAAAKAKQREADAREADQAEPEAAAERGPDRDKSLPADATVEPGKALVLKAYARSRTAKDEAGFSETIDLCRDGLEAGVKPATTKYAQQLMSWSHNRRGELHAAAERDAQAFDDFDAAVELDNNAWRALHNRGVSNAMSGKNDKALADFNRSIELNPEFPIAYFNRAETRYEAGDFEAAIADYDVAAQMLPDDAGIFNSRGHTHFRLGHFKQAVADFNTTLKLDPKTAAAYLNRGDVYAAMGRFNLAARDYDYAIRIRPSLGRAHQSMAWLMATCPDPQFRNPGQAVVAAKMAIELDGQQDHRYLATLAAAFANAGQFEAAEKAQRRAVQGAPASLRPTQEKRLALYHNHRPFRTGQQESPRSTDRQVQNGQRGAPMTTGVRQAGGYTR